MKKSDGYLFIICVGVCEVVKVKEQRVQVKMHQLTVEAINAMKKKVSEGMLLLERICDSISFPASAASSSVIGSGNREVAAGK